MSLYPWRPVCGCLIDEVAGEPVVVEWCGRHDGCRLVVLNASYPPVTNTAVQPVSGSPSPTYGIDPAKPGERPLGPSGGTHGATTGTTDSAEGGQ